MNLDRVQQATVNSNDSNILVVAGAGSGKTRVLTERVKRLLESGVEPHNMVVITFTRMAAEEMRERLADVPNIGDAFVGTIHAFANKLMQNSDEQFEIYSQERENGFVNLLTNKYCKHLTYDQFLLYKDMEKRYEMGLVSEDDLHSFLYPSEQADYGAIFGEPCEDFPETVPSLCKLYNIITFDELLRKATKYFEDLGATVEHVMVDELQDVSYLEYSFIKGLHAKNYFFVGDDWQALYGFKGGDVEIFLRLVNNPDWTKFYLVTNYRSKKEILDTAEIVIRQAGRDIISKEVVSNVGGCGEVTVASKAKLTQYLESISPHEYKDWFLLVRTNKQLFELSAILQRLGIPFSSFKKGDYSLSEIREQLNSNTVKLLTVHSSKGLESKNVMLYGNFPIKQPHYLNNPEERKVMYVGMTRAMDRLVILN